MSSALTDPASDRTVTPKLPLIDMPERFQGPLMVFNLGDRLTLSDLERSVKERQAETSWSIFLTLTSREPTIPLDLCVSLYALLVYAKTLAGTSKPLMYRQGQIDRLLRYVESVYSVDRDQFIAGAPTLPVPRHKILEHCLRSGNRRKAWAVYYQMKKDNEPMERISRNTYLKLLSLIYRDKTLDEASRQLRIQLVGRIHAGIEENGRVLSSANICAIGHICALFDAGRRKEARGLIDALIDREVPRDVTDELVWRVIQFDELGLAEQIIDITHQQRPGIKQNETLYTNLMDAYCQRGLFESALKVFEKMLDNGGKPKLKSFNALLHVYAVQGAPDRAASIFNIMQQLEIVPDAMSFSQVIRAHSKAKQTSQCLYYYNIMRDHDIQPNAYIYSTLIEASASRNDTKQILTWLQSMIQEGIEPNQVIVSSVILALRRRWRSHPNLSTVVSRVAHHAITAGVKADATLFTILLEIQSQADGIEGAVTVHKSMLDRCVTPSVYTYTALIDVCGENALPETAQRIFDLMKTSQGFLPNTATYCALLDAWSKAGRQDKTAILVKEFLANSKSQGRHTRRLWMDTKIRNYIQRRPECSCLF